MLRSTASKVMWVGRATVFLVGLAVILALVLGAATTALSATGGNFILGQPNSADAPTTLAWTGNTDITKSALVLKNIKGGFPLHLVAGDGIAPMKVNSDAKVAKLNADKLDGFDASAFDTANTGKIHRIDSARRVGDGEISLLTVGPFSFVGSCFTPSGGGTPRMDIIVRVGAEGQPHYGAVLGTANKDATWGPEGENLFLLSSTGSDANGYVTGYIYSPGHRPGTVEKGVTFHFYQNRSTHPTLGTYCTFSGYAVEDV